MNTSLLLKAPIHELKLILQEQQEQLIQQEQLMQSMSLAGKTYNFNLLKDEIKILRGEIMIINMIIAYKNNGAEINLEQMQQLKQENTRLIQENTVLKKNLLRHQQVEREMQDYFNNSAAAQLAEKQRHVMALKTDFNLVDNLRQQYSVTKTYTNNMQRILCWIAQGTLQSNTPKAKMRNKQLNHLEEVAKLLMLELTEPAQSASAEQMITNLAAKNLTNLLLQLSLTVKIGFQNTTTGSIENMQLDEVEKADLTMLMKSLVMYGALAHTRQQIAAEVNLTPSRLDKLIKDIMHSLELEIYTISDGLISSQELQHTADLAYKNFVTEMEYLQPQLRLQLQPQLHQQYKSVLKI